MDVYREYLFYLKKKLHDIIGLFEENNQGLTTNIGSLLYELDGAKYLFKGTDEAYILSVISLVESIYDDSLQAIYDENTIQTVRREVFHCKNMINKIIKSGEV